MHALVSNFFSGNALISVTSRIDLVFFECRIDTKFRLVTNQIPGSVFKRRRSLGEPRLDRLKLIFTADYATLQLSLQRQRLCF